jgi:hypothetical protein
VEELGTVLNKECIGETCIVCEQSKEKGIHLYTSFICIECEKEIIDTQTNHPKYKFYLEQLRKITQAAIYS